MQQVGGTEALNSADSTLGLPDGDDDGGDNDDGGDDGDDDYDNDDDADDDDGGDDDDDGDDMEGHLSNDGRSCERQSAEYSTQSCLILSGTHNSNPLF